MSAADSSGTAAKRRRAKSQANATLRLLPADPIDVKPGEPFTVQAIALNRTSLIDAFRLTVLGLDDTGADIEPELVTLLPDAEETVAVRITLPVDYPAGPSELLLKLSSSTEASIFAVETLRLDVTSVARATMAIDPTSATGRRTGRFGLTLGNIGNTPMDIALSGSDNENHFAYRFDPPVLELPAGVTRSVQAVVSGRRSFTGSAVPRQFTITATSPSQDIPPVVAAFAQRPYVPRLALMLAAVVALLGLWGVVVGSAIDSVIKDSKADVATAFKDGMGDVVNGLDNQAASADALSQARIDAVAAAVGASTPGSAAADQGLTGTGVAVGSGTAESAAPAGTSGTATSRDAAGGTAATIVGPPDALVGTIVAASDGRPVPGATLTVQALLEEGSLKGQPDPNRNPIVIASATSGTYQLLDMLPGLYRVAISAPGYADALCSGVVIPTTAAPSWACASGTVAIAAGPGSPIALFAQTSSIAGIVTEAGEPSGGVVVAANRLGSIDGSPSEVTAPVTTGADGRFSFVFTPESRLAPATFELTLTKAGFVTERRLVILEAGDNAIGLLVPIEAVPVPPPTTVPPDQRVLSGIVRDTSGAPLANVGVQLTGAARSVGIVTLADGSWVLDGLDAGTYNVSFSKAGYNPVAITLQVPPASTQPVIVVLTASPVAITGRVVDDLTGVGIAGAVVTDSGGRVVALTDSVGSWRTNPTFGAGTVALTASANGFTSSTFVVDVRPPVEGVAPIVRLTSLG